MSVPKAIVRKLRAFDANSTRSIGEKVDIVTVEAITMQT